MSKKNGPPITVLYGAPDIMRKKRRKAEKEDYPHVYEEEPEVRDDELSEDDGIAQKPAFVCVYASPEWFAQHHGFNGKTEPGTGAAICPRCGTEAVPNANYCHNCGYKLNGEVKV